jgi:hypothetical protein
MKRKEELCLVIIVIATVMSIHYMIMSVLNLPDDVVLLRGTKIDL